MTINILILLLISPNLPLVRQIAHWSDLPLGSGFGLGEVRPMCILVGLMGGRTNAMLPSDWAPVQVEVDFGKFPIGQRALNLFSFLRVTCLNGSVLKAATLCGSSSLTESERANNYIPLPTRRKRTAWCGADPFFSALGGVWKTTEISWTWTSTCCSAKNLISTLPSCLWINTSTLIVLTRYAHFRHFLLRWLGTSVSVSLFFCLCCSFSGGRKERISCREGRSFTEEQRSAR